MHEIDREHVNEMVREEIKDWLSKIWREPSPRIEVRFDDGVSKSMCKPRREESTSAGADICAPYDATIPPHSSLVMRTGLHVNIPRHTCGILIGKSDLDVMFCVTSSGVISEGFSDEIEIRVYNHGEYEYVIRAGDAISQLIIIPCIYPKYFVSGGTSGYDDSLKGFTGF